MVVKVNNVIKNDVKSNRVFVLSTNTTMVVFGLAIPKPKDDTFSKVIYIDDPTFRFGKSNLKIL